jgi:hypothetical protein
MRIAAIPRFAFAPAGALLRKPGDRPRLVVNGVLLLLTLVLGWRDLHVHATRPILDAAVPAHAWFGWADQGEYYRAAKAWAAGNLDGSQHHYPAGYALLAAPFVWLLPDDPFILVNLLCWAASLWLFAALAGELIAPAAAAGRMSGKSAAWSGWGGRAVRLVPQAARAAGGAVFFLVTVMDRTVFYSWETPWTSTPACVCTLGALLLALRFERTARVGPAVGAALLAGLIILFRPTDFAVIAGCVGLFMAGVAAWRLDRRRLVGWALRVAAGFLAGPAILLATHLATHGLALGAYIELSRRIGFEWRLLPLRWVTLLLSPVPLFPAGAGLAQVFWWVLPGIAGIFACVLADRGRRARHALVGGGAIVFLCVYLCYRDLHAPGLFLYHNHHYFKWVIPVFALYAVALPAVLCVRRGWAGVAAGIAMTVLLGCWRPELEVTNRHSAARVLPGGDGIALPDGLTPLDIAYLVAAPDDFLGFYLGPHELVQAGGSWPVNAAFKLFPVPFGIMLTPLRVLPAEPATLRLGTATRLNAGSPVIEARQRIVFGLPCAVLRRRAVCGYLSPLRGVGK